MVSSERRELTHIAESMLRRVISFRVKSNRDKFKSFSQTSEIGNYYPNIPHLNILWHWWSGVKHSYHKTPHERMIGLSHSLCNRGIGV